MKREIDKERARIRGMAPDITIIKKATEEESELLKKNADQQIYENMSKSISDLLGDGDDKTK